MKIKKIINNNIIIAENARGHEYVLVGKSLGFGKVIGSNVDEMLVMKTYSTQEKGNAEKLSRILEDIPANHLNTCDEIINLAKKELPNTLNENIYLSLIDHLTFAIERYKEGIVLTSTLKWEMQQLYANELAIGYKALAIIKKRLDIDFPDDEAAFIAFHLVNAGSSGLQVAENLTFVQNIFEIVKNHYQIDINEESLEYNRFLNHLKYFSYRVINKKNSKIKDTPGYMLKRFQIDLPNEVNCVEKIVSFIEETYYYKVGDNEKEYLIIHLHSMLTR